MLESMHQGRLADATPADENELELVQRLPGRWITGTEIVVEDSIYR
jgi:hypothetical protein